MEAKLNNYITNNNVMGEEINKFIDTLESQDEWNKIEHIISMFMGQEVAKYAESRGFKVDYSWVRTT